MRVTTQELVKSLFDYHEDGYLIWKDNRGKNSSLLGTIAGTVSKSIFGDRRKVVINYSAYMCSRIIFLWHHGRLPRIVDHMDHNTLNDKIDNLRAATNEENNQNTSSHKNSTSKYLGVSLYNKKYWVAEIKPFGIKKYLGSFKTQELAALAYNKAAVRHFGDFANLNIIQYD